ncbi:hypothetical protein ACQ4M3_09565 [Leptolyngbya sp. AN03gr2]|uniref:hypothetical protein n=1 Tax=Leptolyngbya sp. AN03gr2 TaxID=3423364 RepID=UPI003D321FB6
MSKKQIPMPEAAQLLGIELIELQLLLIGKQYKDAETWESMPAHLFEQLKRESAVTPQLPSAQSETAPGQMQLSQTESNEIANPLQTGQTETKELRAEILETLQEIGFERGSQLGLRLAASEITSTEATYHQTMQNYLVYKLNEGEQELSQTFDPNAILRSYGLMPAADQQEAFAQGLQKAANKAQEPTTVSVELRDRLDRLKSEAKQRRQATLNQMSWSRQEVE